MTFFSNQKFFQDKFDESFFVKIKIFFAITEGVRKKLFLHTM